MAGPRGIIPTVKLKHERMGVVIVNESDLDKYRAKGWVLESEDFSDATPPEVTENPPEKKGSMSMTAKEAIEVIGGLSTTELAEFVSDDEDRKTVHEAVDERINELSVDDPA